MRTGSGSPSCTSCAAGWGVAAGPASCCSAPTRRRTRRPGGVPRSVGGRGAGWATTQGENGGVRVIAGSAGGRRVAVPPGRDTRPTSDRAREGLFSTSGALLGTMHGVRVADLFAGSGAVGLEALSRGAGHALLVESHPRAAAVIRENIAALRLPGAEL